MHERKNKNKDGTLVRAQDIANDSNTSYNTVIRLAKECGALIKIGRLSFVDPEIYYRYLHERYTVKDN